MFIPDHGALNATKPPHFNTVTDLHSIIDGIEFFIETPKDNKCQKQTWSSYKYHNTMNSLLIFFIILCICVSFLFSSFLYFFIVFFSL